MLDKKIYEEIYQERKRQHEKWGEQNFPIADEIVVKTYGDSVEGLKENCDHGLKNNSCTFFDILLEEIAEAVSEADPDKQRAEFIQVAAVVVQIIEYIDRQK